MTSPAWARHRPDRSAVDRIAGRHSSGCHDLIEHYQSFVRRKGWTRVGSRQRMAHACQRNSEHDRTAEIVMTKHAAAFLAMMTAGLALMTVRVSAAPPITIEFALGSYGAVAQGHVTMSEPQQTFRLDVMAGQIMIITFAGAGTMRGSVQCAGGVGDGPYYGTGNSISITTTGECVISAGANTMAEPWTGNFTLAVLVYTPRTPLNK
jgi:hypothetical protein